MSSFLKSNYLLFFILVQHSTDWNVGAGGGKEMGWANPASQVIVSLPCQGDLGCRISRPVIRIMYWPSLSLSASSLRINSSQFCCQNGFSWHLWFVSPRLRSHALSSLLSSWLPYMLWSFPEIKHNILFWNSNRFYFWGTKEGGGERLTQRDLCTSLNVHDPAWK